MSPIKYAEPKKLALFAAFSLLLSLCACGDTDARRAVTLGVAPGGASGGGGPANQKEAALRISVAAMLSPKLSFLAYGELTRYLEKRLGLPVKLVFKKNYAETNDSLRHAESDVAFVCTGGYLAARQSFGLDILAVPVVDGKMEYRSLIVARADSRERGLADLKGKAFAFSDEASLTGKLYVQARLADLNLSSGYFGSTVFTGSHDNSIRAVAEKFADAACVNSLVYRVMLAGGDPAAKKLRVLETSPAFGNPPVVARAGLSPELKVKLRRIFLEMHKDEEGRRVLRAISAERFAPPTAGLYSSAEAVMAKAGAKGGR